MYHNPQIPNFSTRYSVMCKVYTGYCGTSEIKHGLCACTVDNPLAKARGLSLRTGAQTMLYLSLSHDHDHDHGHHFYHETWTICPGPEVTKLFLSSTQLSMKIFQLINVKMPTFVGILTFMSGKNSILGLSEPKTNRIS